LPRLILPARRGELAKAHCCHDEKNEAQSARPTTAMVDAARLTLARGGSIEDARAAAARAADS